MGPALTRLFEQSKKQLYEKRDGYTIITDAAVANIKLDIILKTHGEALIEALEELVKINEGSFGEESERWEQLLAQLESEAQL